MATTTAREALATLRALAPEWHQPYYAALAAIEDELEAAEARARALEEIASLDPYPEDIWTPLTPAEEEAVRGAIRACGVAHPLDRTYAQWGRHIGQQYRGIARAALAGKDGAR